MLATSERPSLWVHDAGVRFINGVAEIDAEQAEKLRGVEGVKVDVPQAKPADAVKPTAEPAPAGKARKQEG